MRQEPNRIEQSVPIRGELITLGQLIKLLNLVTSGAEVKMFLMQTDISVNGEAENRRGRKLHPGDVIRVQGQKPVRLVDSPEGSTADPADRVVPTHVPRPKTYRR